MRRPEPAPDRVCLVIGHLAPGGAETQLLLLAEGLHRRGVSTSVAVLFGGGPLDAAVRGSGVELVDLGFRRRPVGPRMVAANVVAFARLVRYLRRSRPDVVHAFMPRSYLITTPAARLARVRAVAGRRTIGHPQLGRPIVRAVDRAVTRLSHLVIANAEAIVAQVRDREGLPARKVALVYNGLPEAAFAHAEPAEIKTELPVVLCVANLWWYKGHRHLLAAAARLRERGVPVTLVLAGDGPERTALERQRDELRLDVRLLGTRDDVARLLARADTTVLPSLTEGLSNAVMEAMAAGAPVVATDVGGTGDRLVVRRRPAGGEQERCEVVRGPQRDQQRVGEHVPADVREHHVAHGLPAGGADQPRGLQL